MEITPPSENRDLAEFKIRASLLLKDLNSVDPQRSRTAARRFCILFDESDASLARVLSARDALRRKHALAVVALEAGYSSWRELRQALPTKRQVVDTQTFFRCVTTGFLNSWFTSYDEAAASLRANGGYLFPYRNQFVVCGEGLLTALGIDPEDEDWERIGRDWVNPRDGAAYERLQARLVALGYGRAD